MHWLFFVTKEEEKKKNANRGYFQVVSDTFYLVVAQHFFYIIASVFILINLMGENVDDGLYVFCTCC